MGFGGVGKLPWTDFKEEIGIELDTLRVLILNEKLFNDVSDAKTPPGNTGCY